MGKLSSHYYSYIDFSIVFKYICYVIIIGLFRTNNVILTVMSIQITNTNSSSALVSPNTIHTTAVTVDASTSLIQGWQCHCWNSSNGSEEELECRCEGSALLRIPQRLHIGVQRLIISEAGLKLLRHTGLKVYASSLQEVMFTDLMDFEAIENSAFSDLNFLRTIYISNAPKLKYLSANVFEGISATFRSLRIVNCGLRRMPDLVHLPTGTILNMVDLEGNQIEEILEKSVNIKTAQLILDSNALTFIHDSAFYGSEIAKLTLKGNQKLRDIHPNAFHGILNIMELDLSSTSITSLPKKGLERLETLRIQNTHSLKTIPSVYTFESLSTAWLTHSFHCCAFKFPQRHDPHRHSERLKYLAEQQKKCMTEGVLPGTENTGIYIEERNDNTNLLQTLQKENNGSKVSTSNSTYRYRIKRYLANYDDKFVNHFEDDVLGVFSVNYTTEYNASDEDEFYAPITGAPISYPDNIESDNANNFAANNVDFGEFFDSTADVSPNQRAICGTITIKKIDVKCYPIPDDLNPCEDVMGSQWLRSSVWIVVLLAVFGNIAVLLVLFSNWKDVTVPKFLMSHLAFADLCLGLYLLLIAAIDVFSMGEYFNFAYDWQYGIGCKVDGFLTVFASHLSVFTLTIITIERWYAITHAIYLNKRLKIKTASVIMICGWIYSMLMSSLPLFGFSNYSSTSICLPMEARDALDKVYLVSIMAINGLAFCIIAICYARIYFSLERETRHAVGHASRGEMTVAKKMALLVFTNFACWAPIAFFGLTALAGLPLIDVAKSKILLVFFYPLNSCADPYLYAILTAQYRRDLFVLLSKYGFFTQKAQQYKMNYSFPTTNHSCPVPLLERRKSQAPTNTNKIIQEENRHNEDFV